VKVEDVVDVMLKAGHSSNVTIRAIYVLNNANCINGREIDVDLVGKQDFSRNKGCGIKVREAILSAFPDIAIISADSIVDLVKRRKALLDNKK
jgi:hypothetical protein